MPELPDILTYIDALKTRVVRERLDQIRLLSPFVLRSVEPAIAEVQGKVVSDVFRVGKRIVLAFQDDLYLVMHLMIAGRLRWRARGAKAGVGAKLILASFDFPGGTLLFTEAGSKKRASLTLVRGAAAVRALDPGGLEPLDATLDQFRAAITDGNHTLKRALTDPHRFGGIGNAYSDEILHAARLSPLKLTRSLDGEEIVRLYDATRATLLVWIDHLRHEARGAFPEKVTAFRPDMAVHGRFKQPCPVCGAPIQRIRYATNECNYCARCQTGGRILADRSLSRLLKESWPRSLDD